MSIQLLLLSMFVGGLSALAILKPATLFQYPVAASLLMLAFILPQAWQIEASGDAIDYDPPLAWGYMLLCMLALLAGFVATSRQRQLKSTQKQDANLFLAKYKSDRLFQGCVVLVIIGAGAWVLMIQAVSSLDSTTQWTGIITLYSLLTSFLLFGTSLSWLLYLYTGQKRNLVLSIIGLSFALPTILIAARRELAFELATAFLLGLYFVRGKVVSRILLLPLLFGGTIYINQASAIRGYIQANKSTLIGALSSDTVTDLSNGVHTSEVDFAVTDIALTQWSGEYALFAPHYNSIVQLYYPAFIFGRDSKNNMRIDQNLYVTAHSAAENGATHTGFGETFVEFHYFGFISFFTIAAILGIFWKNAKQGNIRAQFFYMVLLTEGMMTITEGTTRFVGKAPFLFATMGLVFLYARRRKRGSALTFGETQIPQVQRSQAPLQHDL